MKVAILAGATHFEREPLERLAAAGQLLGYRHSAFWQCMEVYGYVARQEIPGQVMGKWQGAVEDLV